MRVLVVLFLVLSVCLPAGAATPVDWVDLKDPDAAAFEDPFEALGIRQLRALAAVVQLRKALSDQDISREDQGLLKARLAREEAHLAAAGVDTDALLARREEIAMGRARAALMGNPALEGQEISISGYVIPVIDADGNATLGYLVPEYGMCAHIPPPDPNQMIRYRLSEAGLEAQNDLFLYQPVRLTGRLKVGLSREQVYLLDGPIEMVTVLDMETAEITPLFEDRQDVRQRSFRSFLPHASPGADLVERPFLIQ